MRFLSSLILFCVVLYFADATLSASDKKKDKSKNEEVAENDGTLDQSLDDLKLLDNEVSRKTLLKYYRSVSENSAKNLESPTLGFVTPWNNYGYDFAKEFAKKFDMISPVWLQLRQSAKDKACFFTGNHDIDEGWMKELKSRNQNLKILPRVLVEGWTPSNYADFFGSEKFMQNCVLALSNLCQQYKFDGIVLEMWLQAGSEFKDDIPHFLADLRVRFQEKNFMTVFVMPPAMRDLSTTSQQYSRDDFKAVAEHVDYVTIMTYDFFMRTGEPSATAPLPWVTGNIEFITPDGDPNRKKILVGLNFYGYKFENGKHPEAILSRDYIEMLKTYKPKIQWDSYGHENFITFKKNDNPTKVYYPSLRSISDKIFEISKYKSGFAIWEIGQGHRIFAELF